ncbi:unnamed protein product [Rangifer tarandus platyrhynchus]|uniref:Uncharacterized protein n=2 Tax=Rangifer tarandus platyrhynchus TaxID=3082113 RepID=A0ABN8ZL95_RANTA|nr:unnamed protein product [Rangifer tarandus platyrhynchus]
MSPFLSHAEALTASADLALNLLALPFKESRNQREKGKTWQQRKQRNCPVIHCSCSQSTVLLFHRFCEIPVFPTWPLCGCLYLTHLSTPSACQELRQALHIPYSKLSLTTLQGSLCQPLPFGPETQ